MQFHTKSCLFIVNNRQYFITGTDTNVGKTFISTILCKKFNFLYYKPIQTGSLFGNDSDFVSKYHKKILPSKYIFPMPDSPDIAGKIANLEIKIDEINLPNENILIEGAGGILTPISKKYTMLDLAKRLNIPVIIVIKSKLGMINHSLMTIQILRSMNIEITGVIFNGNDYKNGFDSIINHGNVKKICYIPNNFKITDENIANLELNL